MSRQSFFETPNADSNQQPKDQQPINEINVSKFENTIREFKVPLCVEKT